MDPSRVVPASCPLCGARARRVERDFRVRRGERVLAMALPSWECPAGCLADGGAGPFRFATPSLAGEERARMEQAWQAAFGEPLPPVTPPGRKPEERRSVPVHVLLTPSEARLLDKLRGGRSRSEYIRGKALAG